MRPEFIRVLPAEVEQYGAQGAILLAHIRFRNESDGPGRTTVEGVRWWRVSLAQLAQETGLSGKGVRTALSALGDAVAAKHFTPLSDQSRAYRIADCEIGPDLPVAEIGKWADQPVAEIGTSDAEKGISSCRNGQLQMPESASVLLTGEAREGEKPRGQIRWRLSPSPETPPSKTCPLHPHGTEKACGPCGASRRDYKAWVAGAWSWLNEAERVRDNTKDPEQASSVTTERRELLGVLDMLGEAYPV
jgi:hypothetical protein